MRLLTLLPLAVLVACDSGPSKEESVQIYASASASLATAQSAAISQAPDGATTLEYSGACLLGGTVSLNGSYQSGDADTTADSSFDLSATFTSCKSATGTIDGELHWASTATATSITTTMKGDLAWEGNDGSGSCHFDVTTVLSDSQYSFEGTLCGYDLKSDVRLTP